MKRAVLILSCLCVVGIAYAEESCVKKEKDFYGTKYFNRCHCAAQSYPDVTEAMKPLGITTEPRWVACTTLDGAEWCVCGVSLSWTERPTDLEECETRKKDVKKLADRFLEEKENFGVSAPLICR